MAREQPAVLRGGGSCARPGAQQVPGAVVCVCVSCLCSVRVRLRCGCLIRPSRLSSLEEAGVTACCTGVAARCVRLFGRSDSVAAGGCCCRAHAASSSRPAVRCASLQLHARCLLTPPHRARCLARCVAHRRQRRPPLKPPCRRTTTGAPAPAQMPRPSAARAANGHRPCHRCSTVPRRRRPCGPSRVVGACVWPRVAEATRADAPCKGIPRGVSAVGANDATAAHSSAAAHKRGAAHDAARRYSCACVCTAVPAGPRARERLRAPVPAAAPQCVGCCL